MLCSVLHARPGCAGVCMWISWEYRPGNAELGMSNGRGRLGEEGEEGVWRAGRGLWLRQGVPAILQVGNLEAWAYDVVRHGTLLRHEVCHDPARLSPCHDCEWTSPVAG